MKFKCEWCIKYWSAWRSNNIYLNFLLVYNVTSKDGTHIKKIIVWLRRWEPLKRQVGSQAFPFLKWYYLSKLRARCVDQAVSLWPSRISTYTHAWQEMREEEDGLEKSRVRDSLVRCVLGGNRGQRETTFMHRIYAVARGGYNNY